MPFETRGKRRYFYRSEWVGGRPVRRYFGTDTDVLGIAAATADAILRIEMERAARAWQREQARRQAALELLREQWTATDLLARAALLIAGVHRQDPVWRKRSAKRRRSKIDREHAL